MSVNLLYEYGLASSSFINRLDKQRIYCFSPSKIDIESLQYIKGIDLVQYDKFLPDDYKDNVEKQMDYITDYIIENYVHDKILKNLFYGLPEKLPLLAKRKDGYVVKGNLLTDDNDPMTLSENNTYWANLKELQPSGVNILLDEQDEALNTLFENEYERFEDSKENHPEHILGRRLLYIVDRAVFIMYLRQEDYWDKEVEKLYENRVRMLNKNEKISKEEVKKDYYIKAIQALRGVFLYQMCSRPKKEEYPLSGTLFENLEKIEKLLKPISQITDKKGNRMIYCMAVDYLALVYHKKATKKFGEIIGKNDFYLDNNEHYTLLEQKLKESQDNKKLTDLIKQTVKLFFDAASLFKNLSRTYSRKE